MSVETHARHPAPAAPGTSYRVYPYRWVVMGAFMAVNLVIQMLWISYASITDEAAGYYGVSHLAIGLLAMIFMIVFIPLSLPAAWLIDARGFKTAVGIGAVVMGAGGLARGFAGSNYTGALLATIAIAAAQPLLLNAWTKVPANWFAPTERATGVALATLAMLIGVALGEALTPVLIKSMSIASVQLLYGAVAMVSAGVFLGCARERPATPPCPPDMQVRALMFDGLRHALRLRPFRVYLGIWFIGMGVFNGVLTWVDEIVHPRGFSSSVAGSVGALVLLGGVLGSATLAPWSDRRHTRVRFMLGGLVLAVPGLIGLTFATSTAVLCISAFAFGYFLISIGPIGMQYAAEIARPTPEGTSQGVLQLVGQCSVAIVYLMTAMKTARGSYTPALLLTVVLLVVGAVLAAGLKDPAPSILGGVASSTAARRGPPPPVTAPAGTTDPTAPPMNRVAHERRSPMRRTRLVLGVLGGLLLVAGGVGRFVVLPAVAKLPADSNTTNSYAGTAKVLLNEAALAPGSTEPLLLENQPLGIDQMTRVVKANGRAAVVEYRVTGSSAGRPLPGYDVYYAIDRRTMLPSEAIEADGLTAARGITVSFPIGTGAHDYLGWVQDTGTAVPVRYSGTAGGAGVHTSTGVQTKSFGLEAYVFKQTVPPTAITDKQELAALPASIPKSQAEGVIGLLSLPAAQKAQLDSVLARLGDSVPLSYTFAGTYTFWVAPHDGLVLDIEAVETRTVELPSTLIGTPIPIATVSQFEYRDTPATFDRVVRDARHDATALTLIGVTLPIVALVLGAALLTVAVIAGRRRRASEPPRPERGQREQTASSEAERAEVA